MKSTKDFRTKPQAFDTDDLMKKAAKLEPIKKSGKERHAIYSQLDDEDEDAELLALRKKESVLDYFDDGEEPEDDDEDDGFDEEDDEEWDEEDEDLMDDEDEDNESERAVN